VPNCDHCHQPIADEAPVYRLHAVKGSYGAGVQGWVCESCAARVLYRRLHPPVPCSTCGRPVIYDSRRRARFPVCSDRCRRVGVYEREKRTRKPAQKECRA
jgi:hypothetical protein